MTLLSDFDPRVLLLPHAGFEQVLAYSGLRDCSAPLRRTRRTQALRGPVSPLDWIGARRVQ
jgi:hypothetical protein